MISIADVIAEPWAMEPNHLRAIFARIDVARLPDLPQTFFGGEDPNARAKELNVRDGVCHIPIKGTIMKTVPSWMSWFGITATSTLVVQDQLARAVKDPRVKSIMLDIESPGGIVKGIAELADDIAAAADLKPTHAHITDMGASAAYWAASQSTSVSANAMASVGSIGVYTVIEDSSRAYDRAGIKVHVVSTHELKGAGVEGAAITENQLGDMQRMINQYGDIFVKSVAAGRETSEDEIRASATGQVWLADDAKERGLIDHVATADEAHKRAAGINEEEDPKKITAPLGAKEEKSMDKDQAAELEKLKADKEAAEAEAKALKSQMAAIDEERVDALMATYRDRIAPTASADMKDALLKMPREKREGFLQSLAPVTRKDPESKIPTDPKPGAVASTEAGDKLMAKKGGITDAQLAAADQIVGFRADGTYDLKDGRNVTVAEAKKLGLVSGPKAA